MKTKIVKRIALTLFALFISVQTGCVSTVIDDDVASVVEQSPSVVSGRNSGPEFVHCKILSRSVDYERSRH